MPTNPTPKRTREKKTSAPPDRAPAQKRAFLDSLERTLIVATAAKDAGVHRSTVYDWRDSDEEFAREWDEIIERSTDLLEREAYRRAAQGVEEPVYHKGEQVGTVRRYSDRLLVFLLQARRPGVYRQHHTVKHEGAGKDGAIPIEISPVVSEAAHEFLARIRDAGS